MKALIYCRVSSQRQVVEGHGLDSQEQRCRLYAANKQYWVEKVFPDEGISGGLFDRPAMKDLIAYMDAHPLEEFVVIFDDLSRFARDVKVHLQLKAELISRGAKLECLNFNYDDSDESEMAELMLAVSNQYQRKSNRRQVIQKMKARLERGYWPFSMPRGLINKSDLLHGKILVSREPFATIYKEGIELYRDGALPTIDSFRMFVNAKYKEYKLPFEMSFSTATATLKQILYAGYIEYAEWQVPRMKAQHEGFISLETYELVQKHMSGKAKPSHRKDYHLDFPLRRHVLCDSCGTPMTASYHTGRHGVRNAHYYCRKTKAECPNGNRNIRKTDFEDQFEVLLSSVKPADDEIDLTKDVLQEQWSIRLEQYTKQRQTVAQTLSSATDEIDWYVDRIGKTRDEEMIATYEEKIKALKEKKEHAKQDLIKKKYTSEQFGSASEKVFNTLKNPMSMWKSDEYDDKETILFMYFGEQLRYDYERGFGTASLAYPVSLIRELGQAKTASVEMSEGDSESEKSN